MFSSPGFKSSQKGDNYKCFNSTAWEETLEEETSSLLLSCPTQHFYLFSPYLHPPFPSASSRLRVLVPILHSFSLFSPLHPSLSCFWVLLILHIPTVPHCWLAAKPSHCCCWHMAENAQKNENQVCSKSKMQMGIPQSRPGSSPGLKDPQA